MLNGRSLRRRGHGILLGLVAGGLLAMTGNLALQLGAQRVLAVQRIRCSGCLRLHRGQRGLSLVDFDR